MTWISAKAQFVTLFEAVTLGARGDFATTPKHDPALDMSADVGGAGLFFVRCDVVETMPGNWLAGYEHTRADVTAGFYFPFSAGNPSDFDDVFWTAYEKLRSALLLVDNWNRPASTIVCVVGPGEGINVVGEREDVLDDQGQIRGAWLLLRFSCEHEEQGP